jgi:hypothetical protein
MKTADLLPKALETHEFFSDTLIVRMSRIMDNGY